MHNQHVIIFINKEKTMILIFNYKNDSIILILFKYILFEWQMVP